MSLLQAERVHHSFYDKTVLEEVDVRIEEGKVYALIGPNGSGKSTLLSILMRQLAPRRGEVTLAGEDVYRIPVKKVAQTMGVLAQQTERAEVTVWQLVAYGRMPHKRMWQRLDDDDHHIVQWAMAETRISHLADRRVAVLSGGEQQRAWLAMALAQQPQLLCLDEPTTYLDVAHQLEVLDVVAKLNQERGVTVLMVLHDLNHAAAYADEIIVLYDGRIYAQGAPEGVITQTMLNDVFRVEADIDTDPESGKLRLYIKGHLT